MILFNEQRESFARISRVTFSATRYFDMCAGAPNPRIGPFRYGGGSGPLEEPLDRIVTGLAKLSLLNCDRRDRVVRVERRRARKANPESVWNSGLLLTYTRYSRRGNSKGTRRPQRSVVRNEKRALQEGFR